MAMMRAATKGPICLHRSDARIREVITAGIKGEMPSFGKKMGEPEVRELSAYLRTLQG
jgi:mono/diheme cytochrome c family protein